MRRTLKSRRFILTAIAASCIALLWLGPNVAGPPENPPIVLQYSEAPIFRGPHESSVEAVAFSPDGKTIATGAGDLRLWDSMTGRLRSIHADDATRGIDGLAFSPDGRLVAVVGALFADDVVIWDVASGRIAKRFKQEVGSVDTKSAAAQGNVMIYKGTPIVFRALHAVAFSTDGKLLATAGDHVVLRDVQSGKILATLKQTGKGVKGLAFSADGKRLATAGNHRKVELWGIPAGNLAATLDGPTQPLTDVAFSPDTMHVVAASSGNRSILNRTPVGYLWDWDRRSGSAQKVEIGNVPVRQVAFVAPTTVIVGAGRELLSIDLQGDDSMHPHKIWSHSNDILAIAVSRDFRQVASGGADRTVDLVDIPTRKLVRRLPGLMDGISSVATSSDGKRFATATIDLRFSNYLPANEASFAARYKTSFSAAANIGRFQPREVRIWSTVNGRLQSMLPLPASQVTAIKFIPRSNQLAVAGWMPEKGGMLSLWDVDGGGHLRDFANRSAEVLSIAVSPDGQTLVSGDANGNVALWNVQSGAKTRSHKYEYPIEAVTFSADGKLLATGDANRTVRVCDASTGTIVQTLKSRSYVESLDFSPDARRLAAGTRDAGLELWDWRSGTRSRILKAPGDYFEAMMPGFVAFSVDGRFIVCGGHGKDIAVFDAATETLHCELRGHAHPATAVAFLPDGRLVSGGVERTVRLWDPDLNKLLATWIVVPADRDQNWADEWVGYKPSGQFVGSTRLDRLVGWKSGGDVIIGPEGSGRRRRVQSLFQPDSSVPSARD